MERKTMGAPIAIHQAIQFMLADMATRIEAGRQLTYKAAYEIDCGRKDTMYASMAKRFAGDHANKVATDAIKIFGVLALTPSTQSKSSFATPRFTRYTRARLRSSA
ncbi:hypothetical protein PsorP6_010203 [Peronosclerospora sorghi]|uniref:Uncharacterized protein n=1 Tax=Peronosclerospora sorghi TaxID=230839 RepID=A0ACC0VWR8_9STRA|nr:hypothetical protein PsorP6_010203 [Peronosclerospora sorghi]